MKQETFDKHAREIGERIVECAFDYADHRSNVGDKVDHCALVFGSTVGIRAMIQSLVKQKILDSKQAAWLSGICREILQETNLSEVLAKFKAEGGDTIECGRAVPITMAKDFTSGILGLLKLEAGIAIGNMLEQFEELENKGVPFISFSIVARAHVAKNPSSP